jgi:hypothetical protein
LHSLRVKDGMSEYALSQDSPYAPLRRSSAGTSGGAGARDAAWAALGGASACTPPREPAAADWAGWADTPFSAAKPAHGAGGGSGCSAARAASGGAPAPLRATLLGPDGRPLHRASPGSCGATPSPSARVSTAAATAAVTPGAPRESEDLAEQVRAQLQVLLAEKARLAAENARLARENKNLHELLSYTMSAGDEGEGEEEGAAAAREEGSPPAEEGMEAPEEGCTAADCS